jgi:hypothetical protein
MIGGMIAGMFSIPLSGIGKDLNLNRLFVQLKVLLVRPFGQVRLGKISGKNVQ